MPNTSAQTAENIRETVLSYGSMLYRLCFVMLGNGADAEDAVQETFIRYFRKSPVFADTDHEKAWLITTARNLCRDMIRFRARHPQVSLEDLQEAAPSPPDTCILEALMSLPEKFRIVLILYYVEEYPIDQIARMLHRSSSAVKMRLQKGRLMLREKYRKEYM